MRMRWQAFIPAVFAVLTLVILDATLQRFIPLEHRREVAHGIAQFRGADPETLVLGSSHGRTFHTLGQMLAARTGRDDPLVAIPLENGKLTAYRWLLEHRLQPLIDERGADGAPKRRNLRRFMLLTEWWDSCRLETGQAWNLPSRAWAFDHYLGDVARHGVTGFNRNYMQYQMRQLLSHSLLARERTDPAIKDGIARIAAGQPLATTAAEYREKMDQWRGKIEARIDCIGDREQMTALRAILDFARQRRLETTVVLFPRMPGTLTDRAKQTTLADFRSMVEAETARVGAAVVDLTWKTPLTDADFMADFDHVSAQGNIKFAHWALENDLSFLLTRAEAHDGIATSPAGKLP